MANRRKGKPVGLEITGILDTDVCELFAYMPSLPIVRFPEVEEFDDLPRGHIEDVIIPLESKRQKNRRRAWIGQA